MAEATNTINKLTEDELVREACFRRNEQLAHEAVIARRLEQLTEENAKMSATISEKDAALSEMDAALSEKDAALSEKDMIIMELKNKLAVLTNDK